MAIKKISDSNGSTNVKPYLNEFISTLNKADKKKLFSAYYGIAEIVFPKSGKGLIIVCEEFCAFSWKNSNTYKAIQSLLDDPTLGYPMIEVLDENGKFSIALDDEIEFTVDKGNKENFFLIPLSKTNNVEQEETF